MTELTPNRLPEPWGRMLDRSQTVTFAFDGRKYQGFAGDTLASALAANGEFLLSRSFKYHRPRGAYTFAGLDANSYVQVGDEPNVLADFLPISEGLSVSAQNVLGSARNDVAMVAGWLSRFLPVGFYYRAFFRPRGIWKLWESFFRRAAGLGRINTSGGHNRYFDKQYLFADVVVIGAGPAGLSAAQAAAAEGASVLLVDEAAALGGSLNYARFGREREEITSLRDAMVKTVENHSAIKVLSNATCSGWYSDNWLAFHNEQRLFKVRAAQVVLCSGSVEQPAVFRNNDLPGVLPASAVQRLLNLYGVRPGTRAVIVTANAEGIDVAQDLIDAGVTVAAIVDIADAMTPLADMPAGHGARLLRGYVPVEARPGPGLKSIKGLVVARADDPRACMSIDCDLIVTSVGYSPLGQLACHSGGQLQYDESIHAFRIINCPAGGQPAGSVNHVYALDAVIEDGVRAGRHAALVALSKPNSPGEPVIDKSALSINHPYPVFPHAKGKEFVDFDEDQTIADLQNAVADGFDHPELAKRYSTTGMGPSQGRLSATNALRLVQRCRGGASHGAVVTTQRPPFRPISFGVLAGRIFEPERLTPMHHWHIAHNATCMPASLWQRPAFYGCRGERDASIRKEVAAVRCGVGLIDVSTLGGIEIRGPDAGEFLNRMYTFAYKKQEVGRCRYLLMTDDTGAIVDDGVACRVAEEFFYVTTTTTGSDNIFNTMLKRNLEWQLDIDLVNVTSTYAAMNIVGPHCRDIMQKLDTDIDFCKSAFPYLASRQGNICGIPVLAIRVGFVGELGYELHLPSSNALTLWEKLMDVGIDAGITPVGVEAQRVLRLEKGHIIVGQDTDGLTNPHEANLGWAVSHNKPYFVGRPAISHFEQAGQLRRLVGFELPGPDEQLPEECNLVIRGGEITGRVTSIACSEILGKVIGLAYVAPDQAEPRTSFSIKLNDGHLVEARVVELPFYDPDNARQDM